MKKILYNRCAENRNIHFIFGKLFSENLVVYELSKNLMEPDGPPMTSQCGAYALHA